MEVSTKISLFFGWKSNNMLLGLTHLEISILSKIMFPGIHI